MREGWAFIRYGVLIDSIRAQTAFRTVARVTVVDQENATGRVGRLT
jgi:hypothetical protein